MKVKVYKPEAIVTLYTETGELVARATNDPNSKIDDDIISIITSREMKSDCPTFSITLTRAKPWHKWVTSNDLIKIEMERPPSKKAVVFYGLVDDIRKRTAMTGDSVDRVITIVGRGLGKSTIVFDVGIVPEIGYASPDVGWLVANGVTLAGAPANEIITDLWTVLGSEYINYTWEGNLTLYELVKLDIAAKEYMSMTSDMGLLDWSGSVWSLMKEIAEEPFYELFWEIYDDKPALKMRPTPFDSTDWGELNKHIITDEEVIIDDVGRSDLETYTLFSVGAKVLLTDDDPYATMGLFPYWYEPYVNKYGVRRLHVDSIYTSASDDVTVDPINLTTQMQKSLYDWNVKNNAMFNGSFVVKGDTKYKIGERLVYKNVEDDSEIEYYIVSVHHNFINFENWVTQIDVTRGLEEGERFSEPVGVYEEFFGMGIEPLSMLRYGSGDAGNRYYGGDFGGSAGSGYYGGDFSGSAGNLTGASAVIEGALALMRSGKVKYVFGGPGIEQGEADCSQFTQYIYRKYANLNIGRSTGNQVLAGNAISKSAISPGDLIVFKNTYNSSHRYGASHVGIYLGDNKFIHLSTSSDITISTLFDGGFWEKHFLMARRVLPEQSPTPGGSTGQSPTPGGSTGQSPTPGSSAGYTTYEATGYCNCSICNGKWAGGKTFGGTMPEAGRTIAVDPRLIPIGSTVEIKGMGTYIAEDTGSAIKGNIIDIYFNTHAEALRWGRGNVELRVIERGDGRVR